jgi:hypothetical protein
MSDKAFKGLLKVATTLSERAADEGGFVSLTALAREIQADVKFRPLLVEGIAAQPKSKDGRWLILVDSETHPVTEEMLARETSLRPLGARVRNTVAHELAHALGPRFEEMKGGADVSRDEMVDSLERETERLSPALLVPRRGLEKFMDANQGRLQLAELAAERDRLGVSSKVFVNRFELARQEEDSMLRHHRRLADVAIGVGEWMTVDRPEMMGSPFSGFGGMLPEFVALLRSGKKILIRDYFTSADFYLNGGADAESIESLWIGTTKFPQSERASIEIVVEQVPRKSHESFLWLARRQPSTT